MKRKTAWIIGITAMSFILVAFVFYQLFAGRMVFSAVNSYFQKTLGSSLAAASSDFSIFPLRFSMKQPVICALGKDPGHAFLKADKISVGVTWDLILGRKIHFGQILFFKPRVLVEILKDGSDNLPVIDLGADETPMPEIIVDRLSIKEMTFFLRHETEKLTVLSPLLNVEMKLKKNSAYKLSVDSSQPGELFLEGRRRAIDQLRLDGLIDQGRLSITKALIRSERSNLEISGMAGNGSTVGLDLQVKGEAFPEEYADLLPPGYVDRASARLGRLRFGLNLFRDRKLLAMRDIHATFLGGKILGHAEFPRRAEKYTAQASFSWNGLDFSLIRGVLPVDLLAFGSGNLDISFRDRKLPGTEGSLNARFRPKAQSPRRPQGVALAGDLRLDFLPGKILVKKASLQSQGNTFTGELNIQDDRISGSIDGTIGQLRGIALLLSPYNESARWLAEKKIDGEMAVSGNISGTMAKPVLRVDLAQGKIKNLTRSPLDFEGSLSLENRVFRLDNIIISQLWGTAVINGAIPIASSGEDIHLDVRASRLDLARLSKEFYFALPSIAGILDFNVRLTQKADAPFLSDPRLEGDFSCTDLLFEQMRLGTVQGKLNSGNEMISFLFQIPSLNSEISGTTALHDPFATKIGLSTRDGPIGEFLKLLPVPFPESFSGTVTSQAQAVFLPLKFGASLQISFVAPDLLLHSGEQTIRNKKPLRLAYLSGGVIVESLSLQMGQTEIDASGELPARPGAGKEINFSAKGGGGFLGIFLPDLLFEGNLDAQMAIKGSLGDPVFSGSVQVEQGRLLLDSQTLPLTNVRVQLELKDNLMILHALRFNIKEGEVTGTGTLPLPFLKLPLQNVSAPKNNEVYNGDLTIAHCPMAIFQKLLIGNFPENTTGDMSGSIHVKGNNPDLSDLACTATLSLADLNINGLPFQLQEPIRITGNENRIILQEVVLEGQDDLRLAMKGTLDLKKEKALDFFLRGKLDSQVFFGFFPELAGSGSIVFALDVGGTLKAMEWHGQIEAINNNLQFRTTNLFLSQINAAASINNRNIVIERLTANLNGGTIEAKGLIGPGNPERPSTDLQIRLANINLDFPKGLFTNLSGQLQLLSADKEYLLKGTIGINGGTYNEPFNAGSYLYEFLFNRKEAFMENEDADLEKRLRFNINLKTLQALAVENNVCRAELNAELTLGGTYFMPTLAGRIHVQEGGNLFFGNRTFSIEKGQINFINPNFIEPDFNINSSTQIGFYEIKLALSGTPQNFIASFTSIPPLSEQIIVSLLATGKGPDDLSGSLLYETGNSAMNYLGYSITGKLEEMIKRNLGLQSFRIDGSLLSAKEDPGAKITIAKNITPELELTYSQGLRQTQDPTWMLNYKPVKNLNIQGIQSNTDLYTLGVQYQLSFHSRKQSVQNEDTIAKKQMPLLIDKIQIEGDPVLALPAIMKQIKQKPGKVFTFIRFQEDSERLRGLYRKNDYLSAKISGEYHPGTERVTVVYRISAAQKVFLNFLPEGINRSLRNKCTSRWMEGQFEAHRIGNVLNELKQFYYQKKYYQANFSQKRVEKNNELSYIFSIEKGMIFNRIEYDFSGNRQVADNKLSRELKKWRLDAQLFTDPEAVRKKLENYYRQKGFLNAQVSLPRISLNAPEEIAVVRFNINENILFKINRISFSGNSILSEQELLDLTRLKKDMPVSQLQENVPVEKIEDYYREKGFNQVKVTSKSIFAVDKGQVDIEFMIAEGSQGFISEIKIIGNQETGEAVIIRQLTFKTGDAIDFIEINKSRKKLYDLGIFDLVDFELAAVEETAAASTNIKKTKDSQRRKYFQVRVKVKESPDYHFKVGGQYDTDAQIAARFELENRNLFGLGHSIGAGFQLNGKETDLRAYYRLPYLLFNAVNTILTAFSNKKEESLFTDHRFGLTLQEQVKIGETSIFSLNYTWEKSTVFNDLDPGAPAQKTDVAHVTLGYYNDKRDNIFNPGKGFLISTSIQNAAKFFGSDYSFARYSGQFDFYLRATTRLTWATSLSVGLFEEYGRSLPLAEKFFASGRNVIRGFSADEIGPLEGSTGKALGGDAILIFRQELRLQIVPLLSVVGFTDWGNIFAKISDPNISQLRKSAGIGVRIHLQPLLFRMDWGIKLDRRPNESRSIFYFGIGHVF
jgi:outer membrane protein assembly complex protein YaeT